MDLTRTPPPTTPLNITIASNLASLKTWKVENPPSGRYVLTIATTQPFDLSVTTTTLLEALISLGTLDTLGTHVGYFPFNSEPIVGAEVHIIADMFGMQSP